MLRVRPSRLSRSLVTTVAIICWTPMVRAHIVASDGPPHAGTQTNAPPDVVSPATTVVNVPALLAFEVLKSPTGTQSPASSGGQDHVDLPQKLEKNADVTAALCTALRSAATEVLSAPLASTITDCKVATVFCTLEDELEQPFGRRLDHHSHGHHHGGHGHHGRGGDHEESGPRGGHKQSKCRNANLSAGHTQQGLGCEARELGHAEGKAGCLEKWPRLRVDMELSLSADALSSSKATPLADEIGLKAADLATALQTKVVSELLKVFPKHQLDPSGIASTRSLTTSGTSSTSTTAPPCSFSYVTVTDVAPQSLTKAVVSHVHEVDWAAPAIGPSGELRMLACDMNDKVRFTWDHPTKRFCLSRQNYESEYISDDFSKAVQLHGWSKKGEATFSCENQGMFFFAENSLAAPHEIAAADRDIADDAVASGTNALVRRNLHSHTGDQGEKLQRMRIQVTDMSKTATLRGTFNTDPNYQANHWSYSMVMSGYFIDADYNNGFTSDALAETAQYRLWCVQPHADAEGCADWFPSWQLENSPKFCEAMIEADIGYAFRKRPTPDFAKAEEYYDKALALIPDFCPALSYKAGLFVQMGEKEKADAMWASVCGACFAVSLDVQLLIDGYAAKSWALPASGGAAAMCAHVLRHEHGMDKGGLDFFLVALCAGIFMGMAMAFTFGGFGMKRCRGVVSRPSRRFTQDVAPNEESEMNANRVEELRVDDGFIVTGKVDEKHQQVGFGVDKHEITSKDQMAIYYAQGKINDDRFEDVSIGEASTAVSNGGEVV
ncbi:unnamed protein product [Amoebophrya sp. A25]|nr:unnamed protein product [Amoebophrya sp. A25]|eukprot:GSA25T00022759001.1